MSYLKITCLVASGIMAMAFSAHSASVYKKSLGVKKNQYIKDGVIIGGRISDGFTLLDVRRGFSKKSGMERVVLDIGDLAGKPIKNEINYYHVNVDQKQRRVVIDLNQVARSGVDQKQLLKIFKASPVVRSADITFDPEDLTTNLVLKLKRPTKVEVFNLVSTEHPSRIVLDMKPIRTAKKKRRSNRKNL